MSASSFTIGVVGHGIVGSRAALTLHTLGVSVRVASLRHATELFDCSTVILAHGGPHTALASTFLAQGISVVSTSDNLEDVMQIIDMKERAEARNASVIAGASCSPGMSGLLVSHMRRAFESIDEVHTAVHGTGGPMCARQHHEALAGLSVGWHDGEWIQRPAGSGRELCWFPSSVGARDCYRFASPDPVLLQRIEPSLQRITARMSATRRDRLTSRLPMLRKPHAEGLEGGLRVEVRGLRHGKRHVEIVGIADKVGTIAGVVAAHTAHSLHIHTLAPGVYNLGQDVLPNADILDAVVESGITLHQFVGLEP